MAGKSRKEQIEEMLAQDPGDAFLRYALAMELVSSGAEEGALAEFHRLLTDHPGYVAGYFQYGQTLQRLGRSNEARQVLLQGIQAARQAGDLHTAEEMQALLQTIG